LWLSDKFYFSFDFDGEDLVIASRTALQIENRKPPRGHDSNLITFYRITDFRALIVHTAALPSSGMMIPGSQH